MLGSEPPPGAGSVMANDERTLPSTIGLRTSVPIPWAIRLSPRYMTKLSPARKSRAMPTAWARAQRRLLGDEGDLGVELRPVTHRCAHLVRGVPDDDPDVVDPGLGQRVDCVEENRPVGDGDELLRAGMGDRPQPRPLPPLRMSPFIGGSELA